MMNAEKNSYTGWAGRPHGIWHYFKNGKSLCHRITFQENMLTGILGWETVDFKCKKCWRKEKLEHPDSEQ